MKRILLTSAGLTETTKKLFVEAIRKDIQEIKIVLVPNAAFFSDSAREGLLVAMAGLLDMGIRYDHIFVYNLNALVSDSYQRAYSLHIDEMKQPPVFRLITEDELLEYDAILFVGGNAEVLLNEVNRTGFSAVLNRAVENGLFYLGASAGSMIAAGNLPGNLGYLTNALIPHCSNGNACGAIKDNSPIQLNDNQAVWINGDNIEIVG